MGTTTTNDDYRSRHGSLQKRRIRSGNTKPSDQHGIRTTTTTDGSYAATSATPGLGSAQQQRPGSAATIDRWRHKVRGYFIGQQCSNC